MAALLLLLLLLCGGDGGSANEPPGPRPPMFMASATGAKIPAALREEEEAMGGSNAVYGELTTQGVEDMVAITGLRANDRFADFGSGRGQVCITVSSLTGASSLGIEYVRSRHEQAVEELNRFRAAHPDRSVDVRLEKVRPTLW